MNLVERVKAIVLTPKTEWPVIAGEPGDIGHLFANYVAILATIPAVCGFIGMMILGLPVGMALILAILRYVLAFVGVYVISLIIDYLSPTFGGQTSLSMKTKIIPSFSSSTSSCMPSSG